VRSILYFLCEKGDDTMTTKLLLDTDIGGDIDDALCLAYLLAQPECELLGITTVAGEVEKRAKMASILCHVAGEQLPILPGVAKPLLAPAQPQGIEQAAALKRWRHETEFPPGEAIEFLRQTIRAYPGEITLLGIGPMMNIALLFAVDAEIPSLLKQLVLMCGAFHSQNTLGMLLPEREWNALNDPYATAMVYHAPVQHHRSIGLDVTTPVTMNAQQFRERCVAPLLQPVLDFAEIWFQENEIITFHDPLAATTIFDNTICTFQRGNVQVELAAEGQEGKTHWEASSQSARHEVAVEVQPDRFFEHFFSVFASE
jgi:purine nucleosidase